MVCTMLKFMAFDNWGKEKFDWCKDMKTDSVLRAAVDYYECSYDE